MLLVVAVFAIVACYCCLLSLSPPSLPIMFKVLEVYGFLKVPEKLFGSMVLAFHALPGSGGVAEGLWKTNEVPFGFSLQIFCFCDFLECW